MFFPLKDDNPTTRTPVVTLALIAINLAVFIFQYTLPEREAITFLYEFGMVPAWALGHAPANLPTDWLPRQTTFITHIFLHGGIFHVASNMWFLWIFGNNIEDILGPVRFSAFYLLGGMFAGLCQLVANTSSQMPVVGASGAIAAVLGAYLLLFPKNKVLVLVWLFLFVTVIKIPSIFMLGGWFLLQVIWQLLESSGEEGGVAWMAHIGGFVFGLFTIKFFTPRIKPRA